MSEKSPGRTQRKREIAKNAGWVAVLVLVASVIAYTQGVFPNEVYWMVWAVCTLVLVLSQRFLHVPVANEVVDLD